MGLVDKPDLASGLVENSDLDKKSATKAELKADKKNP